MRMFIIIIFAAALIGPGFSGPLDAFTQSDEKKAISDWLQNVPSEEGWRSLKWGMSIEELLKAYPNEIERSKKPGTVYGRNPGFLSTYRARFKQQLLIDSQKYYVNFGFDDDNHLNYVELVCDYRPKDRASRHKDFYEAAESAARNFTELLGEPSWKSDRANRILTGAHYLWGKSNVEIELYYAHSHYLGFPLLRKDHKDLRANAKVISTD